MPNLGFRWFSGNSIFFAVAPIRCIGVPDLMSAELHPHMSPAGIEHMIGGEASADARRRAHPRDRAKARAVDRYGSITLGRECSCSGAEECGISGPYSSGSLMSGGCSSFSSSSGSRGAIVFAADDAAGSILAF
jgi:hypothetical protein